ncbi:HEPN domain-containing protein [Staphylococcus nepalensis]
MKLKKINNFDEFNVSGSFYLINEMIAGEFVGDGENFKLNFHLETPPNLEKRIDKLLFYTTEGETLILLNGLQTKFKFSFPGFYEIEYLFTQFCCSLQSNDLPQNFSGVSINFSNLKNNLKKSPIEISKKEDEEEVLYSVSVEKSKDNEILLLKDSTLFYRYHPKLQRSKKNELTFHYDSSLKKKYNNKTSLEQCINDATTLTYLFSFITNEKHKIYNITLFSGSDNYRYFVQTPYKFKENHKNNIIFTTSEFIERYFAIIYKYFYQNSEYFEDIFDYYINIMYTTKFISPNLVDLLRINEGIHRRVTGNKNMNLKKRYESLLYSLDKELQKYLKSIFNYDEEIHNYLKEFRHYYSHFFPTGEKPKYNKDTKLNIMNYVLQLHKAYIFYNMGIPAEDIIELLKVTHPKYE